MTKIYNRKGDLIFQDDNLSLKELVEKNKKNLTEANLEGARLHGANLKKANLSGANLRDADLDKVNIDEVICFKSTILPNGKSLRELLLNELLNKGE